MTEWLPIHFLERSLGELSCTVCASEVFGVELQSDGRDAASSDRLSALCTQGSSLLVVVSLAEGNTLMVEEGTALERLVAHLQHAYIHRHINTQTYGMTRTSDYNVQVIRSKPCLTNLLSISTVYT